MDEVILKISLSFFSTWRPLPPSSFGPGLLTFVLSPSLTLIHRGRFGSPLWGWGKVSNTLPESLSLCVCEQMGMDTCSSVHTPLLVSTRETLVWMYKRIQWCSVEFISICRKRPQQQDRESLSFCSEFRPHPHRTHRHKHSPGLKKSENDIWSSHLW